MTREETLTIIKRILLDYPDKDIAAEHITEFIEGLQGGRNE